MTTLEEAAALASRDHGLVVISTLRSTGTIQASLVNAGVIAHPATGENVLGIGHRRPDQAGQPPRPSPSDCNLSRRLAVGSGRKACRARRAR